MVGGAGEGRGVRGFHAKLVVQKPAAKRGNDEVNVNAGGDEALDEALGVERARCAGDGGDDVHVPQ